MVDNGWDSVVLHLRQQFELCYCWPGTGQGAEDRSWLPQCDAGSEGQTVLYMIFLWYFMRFYLQIHDQKRTTAFCHVQLCFLNFASSMVLLGSPGHLPEETCFGLRCEMYDSIWLHWKGQGLQLGLNLQTIMKIYLKIYKGIYIDKAIYRYNNTHIYIVNIFLEMKLGNSCIHWG